MPAYHLTHPALSEPHRIHADAPATLHAALGLLPAPLRRHLDPLTEQRLLRGVAAGAEATAGAWTLRRLEDHE